MAESKWEYFLQKLRFKYRLVILDDDTFEEKFSLKLSRLNVFTVVGTSMILLVLMTTVIIAFTPLREYIPGYTDTNLRKIVVENTRRADSLEQALKTKDLYFESIKNLVLGSNQNDTSTFTKINEDEMIAKNQQKIKKLNDNSTYKISKEDSMLRAEIEAEDQYNVVIEDKNKENNNNVIRNEVNISQILFFPPIKGSTTGEFDPENNHFGMDFVSDKGQPIKAALDGTVCIATWTLETGYVIGIQHSDNLITFYKHNSILLKKVGSLVRAGDPIAIIGNSGELSTGPHLHFEIWYNGKPVNPAQYISF